MAMTCRGILALPYANRLRLVAGASGGGNEIRWVHILEEPKYTAWLKGASLSSCPGWSPGTGRGLCCPCSRTSLTGRWPGWC